MATKKNKEFQMKTELKFEVLDSMGAEDRNKFLELWEHLSGRCGLWLDHSVEGRKIVDSLITRACDNSKTIQSDDDLVYSDDYKFSYRFELEISTQSWIWSITAKKLDCEKWEESEDDESWTYFDFRAEGEPTFENFKEIWALLGEYLQKGE